MSALEVRTADGLQLHAEVHGEGPPLVLSCAFVTTCENFRPQVEPLVKAGWRVVLWDYRGCGRSEVPEDFASYSMEQVVEDLGRVLDRAAPGERAVLGGLSFGGLVSLHFALEHPGRVRALLLLGSGPGFKNPEAATRWQEQVDRTGEILVERGMAAFTSGKAAATTVGRAPELPAARAAARAIEAQDPRSVAAFGSRVAGPAKSAIDRLGEIDVPVLVLVGAEDGAYLRAADVMAAKLPRATRVLVPGAGHIANIEAESAVNAELQRFLEGLDPA